MTSALIPSELKYLLSQMSEPCQKTFMDAHVFGMRARPSGRGKISSFFPFAHAWTLSTGLIQMLKFLPAETSREAAAVLWKEIFDKIHEIDALKAKFAVERANYESRIDALNGKTGIDIPRVFGQL